MYRVSYVLYLSPYVEEKRLALKKLEDERVAAAKAEVELLAAARAAEADKIAREAEEERAAAIKAEEERYPVQWLFSFCQTVFLRFLTPFSSVFYNDV